MGDIILNPACDSCSCQGTHALFIAGDFTTVGGVTQSYVAKLTAGGAVDMGWTAVLNGTVLSMVLAGNAIYVGGNFTTINGVTRNFIGAIDATDGSTLSWNPNANGTVRDIAVDAGIVYFVGGFSTVGGISRPQLAALTTSGVLQAITATFNLNGPDVIAVDSAVAYIFGNWTTINGVPAPSNSGAGITLAGAVTSWAPTVTNASVNDAIIVHGICYVVGSFNSPQARAAAYDLIGAGTLQPWDPVGALGPTIIQGLQIYFDGISLYMGTISGNGLYEIQGGAFTSFNVSATNVRAMAVSNGTIYFGGSFTTVAGQARNRAAAAKLQTSALNASWNPNCNNVVRAMALAP